VLYKWLPVTDDGRVSEAIDVLEEVRSRQHCPLITRCNEKRHGEVRLMTCSHILNHLGLQHLDIRLTCHGWLARPLTARIPVPINESAWRLPLTEAPAAAGATIRARKCSQACLACGNKYTHEIWSHVATECNTVQEVIITDRSQQELVSTPKTDLLYIYFVLLLPWNSMLSAVWFRLFRSFLVKTAARMKLFQDLWPP